MGQLCEDGTQLRPDIVWFGENVEYLDEAMYHVATAGKVLVVGTSLTVFPVAGLVKAAQSRAERVLVALEMDKVPYGFKFVAGKAGDVLPALTARWLGQADKPTPA
jgi:NAD-dependent deacetylase